MLGAIGAAAALIASVLVPTVANAAPPQAGTYEGASTAYTGATVSFDIDANGVMSNFNSESYCTDGFSVLPVQWSGMPATQIEAGQPFDLYWELGTDEFRPYYELQGVVNADGSASGTGRAGFLPSGSCGGMNFSWTATNTGGGDPDPGDPEIEITPDTVTESELADPGVRIDGEGFPGSDWVDLYVNGVYSHRAQSSWDGAVTAFYDSGSLGVGTHELTLTGGGVSASGTLTVTEDPVVYDPIASVTPQELTESELADSGVTIAGVDFAPESSVTLSVNGSEEATQAANADGGVSFSYTSGSLGAGSHQVTLTSGDLSAGASFTVTEDPVVYDPSASVTPEEVTESELADDGVTITGTDFPAGADVVLSVGGSEAGSEDATAAGEVSFSYTSASLGVGTHQVTLVSDDLSASASFTVTEDPVVYDPSASVAPQELTESELADAGVMITGVDFAPESDVTLSVNSIEEATQTADADGAVASPYTSDSLGAGTHQVTLVSGDLSASASFTVTEDPVVYDPSASVAPQELTESELADAGVTITGVDFPASAEVSLTVNEEAVDTASSNEVGEVEFIYTSDALGTGTHTVGLVADGEGAYASATFTVTEDEAPQPETIPADAPAEEDLDPALEGAVTAPAEAEAGESITVTVGGVDPGTEVGVWLFSDPVYLGTHAVDANGDVVVTIPTDTELGEHTIAVWAAPDTQVGWAEITIVAADDGGNGSDDGDGDGGGDHGGDSGGDSGGGSDGDGGGAEQEGDTGSGEDSGGSDAGEGSGGSEASEGDLAATGAPYLPLMAALVALLLALGATLVWHTSRGRSLA